MNLVTVIGSTTTVLSMLAFVGIVWFALGRSRLARFEAAAQAPFALPDDLAPSRGGDEASS